MHQIESNLLTRQLRKYLSSVTLSPEFDNFIRAIDVSYCNAERDNYLLRQSLTEMSEELNTRNEILQNEKNEQQKLIKKLEDTSHQLIQSEKMASIGQLAAGVAHEINNPIGYIASNLSTLEKYLKTIISVLTKYEDASSGNQAFQDIHQLSTSADLQYIKSDLNDLFRESFEGIDKVKKIIQDLKDFSRVDKVKDWEFSDLHKGLDSALNIAASEIKYKADIEKHYGELPLIECRLSQLNQVFLNIIINAAQSLSSNIRGKITLTTKVDDNYVIIKIADNGCGIPKEILGKIFDPFFTTKPVGVGTGLGLSISYGIISEHGGTLTATSEVGVGTQFIIRLPIKQISPT